MPGPQGGREAEPRLEQREGAAARHLFLGRAGQVGDRDGGAFRDLEEQLKRPRVDGWELGRGFGAAGGGHAALRVVRRFGVEGEVGGAEAVPSVSVSPPEGVEVPDGPVEAPSMEPEYPSTAEGEIDKLADERGWVVDDLYSGAAVFVQDMCDSLPVSAVEGMPRPQWLAEGGYLDGDGAAVLQAGVPKLCPKCRGGRLLRPLASPPSLSRRPRRAGIPAPLLAVDRRPRRWRRTRCPAAPARHRRRPAVVDRRLAALSCRRALRSVDE